MKVQQILKDRATQHTQKPAIVFKDKPISFSDLDINVRKLANELRNAGVKKGDKVAIYLPNCPGYIESYLAIFCLGAVGVPLDFVLRIDELRSCLSHSETKYFITVKKEDIDLAELDKSIPSLEEIIIYELDDSQRYHFTFKKQPFPLTSEVGPELTPENISDEDPALIMYTSGTTGKPKGILLNYRHLDGSPRAMEHFVDLTDKDVKLSALPLSHIAGLIYIQNCIMFGITLIVMERFNPFEFLQNIQKHKVTCFHIVPAMYMALLSLKEIEKFDLSSLRWVVVFGAPSSPAILRKFHQYCPNAHFLNGWGMTETCPPNVVTPLGSDKIASVGKPSPHGEIKIFNEEEKEAPQGEIGEIVIRGWVVMEGYYKDPETTQALIRDGWFHTGDLGRFDEEGYLYIVGRKKEMIKVGGQIVYAPEVESALLKNDAILEAAVIGVPDQLRGEVVKAFVVLKERNSASVDDLRYFAKDHLANFKVPQNIELRDELPKNRTGKIDKEALKGETAGAAEG